MAEVIKMMALSVKTVLPVTKARPKPMFQDQDRKHINVNVTTATGKHVIRERAIRHDK